MERATRFTVCHTPINGRENIYVLGYPMNAMSRTDGTMVPSQWSEIHGALWKKYAIRMCALMGAYTTSLRLVSVYLSSTAAGLPCLQVGGAFVGGRPFSGGSGSIARKRVTPPPPLCSFAVLRFSAVRFLPCETAPAWLGTRAQRQEITPGVFFTLRGTAVLLRRRVAQAQR